MAAYKDVAQYIYMGYLDKNDTLPFSDTYGPRDREITKRVLGEEMFDRWKKSQQIYNDLDIPAQMVTYDGTGHQIKDEMLDDIVRFFKKNEGEAFTPIKPHKYPFVERKELSSLTMTNAYWNGDERLPGDFNDHLSPNEFVIQVESLDRSLRSEVRRFLESKLPEESQSVTLKHEGKPDLKAKTYGNHYSSDFIGIEFQIEPESLDKMEVGIPYTIHINNKSEDYHWILDKKLTITRTQ